MHYLIKSFVPPIAQALKNYSFKYGWKGNYETFQHARKECKGYDEAHILNRIIQATEAVKSDNSKYERDGVLYDGVRYNSNVLSALLLAAARNGNKLTVLDFGGSFGSSYYQHIQFLAHVSELKWCIIEQVSFVKVGKQQFENEHIRFYHSLAECRSQHNKIDLVLISNSLQYLEEPYEMLHQIQLLRANYLVLDYVGYNRLNKDRITVQYVPPYFYGVEASYPCMFFHKARLHGQLGRNYTLLAEFRSGDDTFYVNMMAFRYEGSLWMLQS